jgi:hypothetical protein
VKIRLQIVLVLLVIGFAIFCLWQHQVISDLRRQVAEAQQRQETASAQNTQVEADRTAAQTKELQRLRSEHTELLRLRGEITRLQKKVAAKVAGAPSANAPLSATLTNTYPSTNDFVTAVTNVTVPDLKNNEALITELPVANGTRVFACAAPTLIDAAGNAVETVSSSTQLTISSWLFEFENGEVPEEVRQALESTRLPNSEFDSLLQKLKAMHGVSVLIPPRVTTLSGNPAQIAVGDSLTAVDQGTTTQITTGPTLDFTPKFSIDGSSVSLTMKAQLTHKRNR